MINRRKLFKLGALTLTSLPFLKVSEVFASVFKNDACKVPPAGKMPKDKVIKRVAHVADAKTSTHKKYEAGAACANCKYYKAKVKDGKIEEKGDFGCHAKCAMVGNKYVNRNAWCNKYKKHKERYAIYTYK